MPRKGGWGDRDPSSNLEVIEQLRMNYKNDENLEKVRSIDKWPKLGAEDLGIMRHQRRNGNL